MGNVDDVVDWALGKLGSTGEAGSKLEGIKNDPDFQEFYQGLLDSTGAADTDTAVLNALVMYAAGKSQNFDAQTAYDALMSGSAPYSDGDKGEQVAGLALQYGLGMAYVRSEQKEGRLTDVDATNPTDVFNNAINKYTRVRNEETGRWEESYGADFQAWLQNHEADVAGYLGAMSMIADNTANVDTQMILTSGYGSNTDLIELINTVLGRIDSTNP